jgi:hypothetical protein
MYSFVLARDGEPTCIEHYQINCGAAMQTLKVDANKILFLCDQWSIGRHLSQSQRLQEFRQVGLRGCLESYWSHDVTRFHGCHIDSNSAPAPIPRKTKQAKSLFMSVETSHHSAAWYFRAISQRLCCYRPIYIHHSLLYTLQRKLLELL